jgi:hypothetical protein
LVEVSGTEFLIQYLELFIWEAEETMYSHCKIGFVVNQYDWKFKFRNYILVETSGIEFL